MRMRSPMRRTLPSTKYCTPLAACANHIDVLSAVAKRGVARDDAQLPESRQLGDDVFGYAIAEVLLIRVATHIREGQHGDRGLRVRGFTRADGDPRCAGDAPDADRLVDVLQRLGAEVFESRVDLV